MKNAKRLRCTSAAAPDCYSAQSVRHAPAGAGDGSISDEQYEQVSRALREKMDRNRRG